MILMKYSKTLLIVFLTNWNQHITEDSYLSFLSNTSLETTGNTGDNLAQKGKLYRWTFDTGFLLFVGLIHSSPSTY